MARQGQARQRSFPAGPPSVLRRHRSLVPLTCTGPAAGGRPLTSPPEEPVSQALWAVPPAWATLQGCTQLWGCPASWVAGFLVSTLLPRFGGVSQQPPERAHEEAFQGAPKQLRTSLLSRFTDGGLVVDCWGHQNTAAQAGLSTDTPPHSGGADPAGGSMASPEAAVEAGRWLPSAASSQASPQCVRVSLAWSWAHLAPHPTSPQERSHLQTQSRSEVRG